ncbi:hypothetical protein BN135_1109 [Cronobacter muytjensii 530]
MGGGGGGVLLMQRFFCLRASRALSPSLSAVLSVKLMPRSLLARELNDVIQSAFCINPVHSP